jgi:hypothetical protein
LEWDFLCFTRRRLDDVIITSSSIEADQQGEASAKKIARATSCTNEGIPATRAH